MRQSKPSGRLVGYLFLFCFFYFSTVIASDFGVRGSTYFAGSVSSGESLLNPDSVVIQGQTTWQLIKTTPQIKIYYREADCIDNVNGISMRNVYFKVENLTSSTLNVVWYNKLYYDYQLHTGQLSTDENKVELVLMPNQILEASCGQALGGLVIYLKMIGMPSEALTSFEILNLLTN